MFRGVRATYRNVRTPFIRGVTRHLKAALTIKYFLLCLHFTLVQIWGCQPLWFTQSSTKSKCCDGWNYREETPFFDSQNLQKERKYLISDFPSNVYCYVIKRSRIFNDKKIFFLKMLPSVATPKHALRSFCCVQIFFWRIRMFSPDVCIYFRAVEWYFINRFTEYLRSREIASIWFCTLLKMYEDISPIEGHKAHANILLCLRGAANRFCDRTKQLVESSLMLFIASDVI